VAPNGGHDVTAHYNDEPFTFDIPTCGHFKWTTIVGEVFYFNNSPFYLGGRIADDTVEKGNLYRTILDLHVPRGSHACLL